MPVRHANRLTPLDPARQCEVRRNDICSPSLPGSLSLLGSWLLRVAQLYGLGLTTLLSRLGARPTGDAHVPHWFAIGGASISLDALSTASCLSRVDLAAMAPPSCRPRWPEERPFELTELRHRGILLHVNQQPLDVGDSEQTLKLEAPPSCIHSEALQFQLRISGMS